MSNVLPISSLFDDLFSSVGSSLMPRSHSIPLNVRKQNDDTFAVEFYVPGFMRDEIDVSFDSGVLEVTASKETEQEADKSNGWIVREHSYSKVSRRISLPENVDIDKVSADLSNGVLTVVVPVASNPPKKIDVKENKKLTK